MNTRGAATSVSRKRKSDNGSSGSTINRVPTASTSAASTPTSSAPTSSAPTSSDPTSTQNVVPTTGSRKRKAHEAVTFDGYNYHKNGGSSDGTTEYFECAE